MNNFQKYLSYFIRIVVEKRTSQFNPGLIVAIQNGKYVLNSKNANYSFASLHRVFQQGIAKIENKDFKTVLLLGCGAGSIPSIIYNELKLNPEMDAVEIDKEVIDLGNRYFALDQYPQLNIIIDDAAQFVKTTTRKYDLILVDLFKGINVPDEFVSQHFLEQLKTLLNDGGELLFNYVVYNYETKQQMDLIKEKLNKVFPTPINIYKIEDINRIFHVKK